MIHSLYGNKEIFLRELVSNASDAADKLRFEALANNALYENDPDLKIRDLHRQGGAHDHRVGQRHRHVARRGRQRTSAPSRAPARASSSSRSPGTRPKDAHLIGQFGVGFYSSFIVADRVTLITRRAGLPAGEGVRWECDMAQGRANTPSRSVDKERRGTDVTLHLREGEDDLLDHFRLQQMIRKYSDHIAIPIVMKKREWDARPERVPRHRRGRDGQPGERPLGAPEGARSPTSSTVEFYKHVAHDMRAAARLDPQPRRGPPGVHAAPLHPGARAVRPVGPRASARPQALRAARLHHGRRRAAAARVPALRARHRGLERPAAQRLARDPAGMPATSRRSVRVA